MSDHSAVLGRVLSELVAGGQARPPLPGAAAAAVPGEGVAAPDIGLSGAAEVATGSVAQGLEAGGRAAAAAAWQEGGCAASSEALAAGAGGSAVAASAGAAADDVPPLSPFQRAQVLAAAHLQRRLDGAAA